MVCFSPVAAGAVAAGIAAVTAGASDWIAETTAAVGDAAGIWAGVAAGALVWLPVQPATHASMRTAARHRVIFMNEFHFALMVFDHAFYAGH
jgi:hypothetical protein